MDIADLQTTLERWIKGAMDAIEMNKKLRRPGYTTANHILNGRILALEDVLMHIQEIEPVSNP